MDNRLHHKENRCSRRLRRVLALTGALGLAGIAIAPSAFAETVGIQTTTVPDALTTTSTPPGGFVPFFATSTCGAGSTLLGGGARLSHTADGTDIGNDGAVLPALYPSDAAGNTLATGATTPSSWTAVMEYTGSAPGTDSVTSFAMCATGGPTATVVQANNSGTGGVGPVTAVCPSGTTLVGGGGGYTPPLADNGTTAFNSGVSQKLISSYPSDSSGAPPANGFTGATSWTVLGNSNSGTGTSVLNAYAVCATDMSVTTQVVTNTVTANNPASAQPIGAPLVTATCPSGSTLLSGGAHIGIPNPNNVANPPGPNQGVHLVGTFPSDASGAAATTSASSWTVRAINGGTAGTGTYTVDSFALCDITAQASVPEVRYPALMVGFGALLVGGFLAAQRRRPAPAAA